MVWGPDLPLFVVLVAELRTAARSWVDISFLQQACYLPLWICHLVILMSDTERPKRTNLAVQSGIIGSGSRIDAITRGAGGAERISDSKINNRRDGDRTAEC